LTAAGRCDRPASPREWARCSASTWGWPPARQCAPRKTPDDGNTVTGKAPPRPTGRSSRNRSWTVASTAAPQGPALHSKACLIAQSELAKHRRIDAHVTVLSAMAQQMIHQHQGHHGFSDGRCPNPDTRVMAPLGDYVDRVAVDINGAARRGDTGGRLEGQVGDERLAGGNPAQHTAGVVAEKPARRELIAVLGAALADRSETRAHLHTLDRVDAHQRIGQLCIRAIEDRLAQTRRYAFGDHGNLGTHRILVAAQLVHIGFQLRHLVRVGAEEGVLADRLPALEGNLDRTQLAHIATHSNALAGKILARN